MDGLVSGLYKPGDVRDFLDRYHDEDTPPMPAHQYLGMTVDEYRSWKDCWRTDSPANYRSDGQLARLAERRRQAGGRRGTVDRVLDWLVVQIARLLLGW
jgi:hypothetical protein